MGTDRWQKNLCPCLCGNGTVEEHLWSDDHPFGDYSWRSNGIALNCATCGKDWVVTQAVANPIEASANHEVIYFVARAEYDEVEAHNKTVDADIARHEQEVRLRRELIDNTSRSARTELLRRVMAAGSRLEDRFRVIGPILGIDTVENFRTIAGRSLPKTYVPKLFRKADLITFLERMDRHEDANAVRRAETESRGISEKIQTLRRTKKLPRASHQQLAPIT